MKLNVLLAKSEHSASTFKKMTADYLQFFTKEQGQFKGARKDYKPRDNMADYPNERGSLQVVTTVQEKLTWLAETSAQYIDNLFSVEASNAANIARVELKVDGKSFGTFSSLELLRLKSLLETSELEKIYAHMPVRSDAEIWFPTTDELYAGRDIYQKERLTGQNKTTVKEAYILPDPNIHLLSADNTKFYTPQLSSKDTTVILGDYTIDFFSGEATQRYKAEVLRRRSNLLDAVIEKLKMANEVEAVTSDMTAKKLFNYLHTGSI